MPVPQTEREVFLFKANKYYLQECLKVTGGDRHQLLNFALRTLFKKITGRSLNPQALEALKADYKLSEDYTKDV